jgi:8-oxo-dGTP pyrophosphatase MutT (NUDIX family)
MDLHRVADRERTGLRAPDRQAAVLVPVLEAPTGPELLFIRRADHLLDHPGEMSFPGGGVEPEDRNLEGTAIREAGEEVGLAPEEIDPVGRLDDVRTVSGYTVTPIVAAVPDRTYEPGDAEVAAAVTLPVADLTDPTNYAVEPREHPSGESVPAHHFRVDGYTIWGATARMLVQFFSVATGWSAAEPTVDQPEDP